MKPNSGRCRSFVNLERTLTLARPQAGIGARFRGAFVHDNFRASLGDAWLSGANLGARR